MFMAKVNGVDVPLLRSVAQHGFRPAVGIGEEHQIRARPAQGKQNMIYLLKGIPFIYQGQEIGIAAAHYDSIEDFDDVESLNAYRDFCQTMSKTEALEKINFGSRDNARHPMPWNNGPQGGFSTGKPWIALHSRFQEINVEKDQAAEQSIYRFYQALLNLRRTHDAFLDGSFRVISTADDPFFIYTRSLGSERWIVVCNFDRTQMINVPFECNQPLLSNLGRSNMNGEYQPYECAISQIK